MRTVEKMHKWLYNLSSAFDLKQEIKRGDRGGWERKSKVYPEAIMINGLWMLDVYSSMYVEWKESKIYFVSLNNILHLELRMDFQCRWIKLIFKTFHNCHSSQLTCNSHHMNIYLIMQNIRYWVRYGQFCCTRAHYRHIHFIIVPIGMGFCFVIISKNISFRLMSCSQCTYVRNHTFSILHFTSILNAQK